MENKKDMSDNKSDAEIVATATAAEANDDVKSSSPVPKLLGFVLLVLVIIGGGLAANGQLMPTIATLKAKLSTQQSAEPEPQPVITSKPEPVVEEVTASAPAINIEEAQETQTLLSTIEMLRSELQNMEASQRSLQQGLIEQQQMNLQVRLRWITDPASRAPQIKLAWEEISLLPGLSSEQRSTAEEMHALARSNVQKLQAWQAALTKWADALSTPVHEDILPQPEHPWLAWIVGQFHLRQAPSEESRRLTSLRQRLLDVSRALTLENWPSDGAWQSLHAELLLQAKAMQGASDGDAIDLGLPENFSEIINNMTTLRDAARQWTQSGRGEF